MFLPWDFSFVKLFCIWVNDVLFWFLMILVVIIFETVHYKSLKQCVHEVWAACFDVYLMRDFRMLYITASFYLQRSKSFHGICLISLFFCKSFIWTYAYFSLCFHFTKLAKKISCNINLTNKFWMYMKVTCARYG